MAVTAGEVKALRDETGAGMMDCKRALEEAAGDVEKAKDLLRRRGQAKGGKREGKVTAEGCITAAVSDDLQQAVILELNCETDFVGRTEDFRSVARRLADEALRSGATTGEAIDAGSSIDEAVSRLGEAVRIGRYCHWTATAPGLIATYLHTATHRVAVLLEIGLDGAADLGAAAEVGRDLAMQVAAMRPLWVDRDGVPPDRLAREREVLQNAEDMAGKPPQVQEKIIAGRLEKNFYGEVCLVEQSYAKDPEKQVREVLSEAGKRLGAGLAVRRFCRLEVGRE